MVKRWMLILLGIPCLLWLLSLPSGFFGQLTFWDMRREGIYLSGILAYVLMAWSMLLATRANWLESVVGGLDRGYLLHKWGGITAAVLVFAHWMIEIVPKSLSKAGWIERPARKVSTIGAEPFFNFLRDPAKDIAEWLAYIGIILIVLALIKRIPHRWFRLMHKVFPIIFLLATFHSLVLLPDALWLTLTGVMIGACAVFGCAAALLSLSGKIGRARQVTGQVSALERLGQILCVTCRLDGASLNYQAGQFAYLRFAGSDSPHPFTIASYSPVNASNNNQELRFYIKALGDDTQLWLDNLQPLCAVIIEGPYGRFNFAATQKKQEIWVAGGIGITPFMARMEYLAQTKPPNGANENLNARRPAAQLFYCTQTEDPLLPRLSDLCASAAVNLHVVLRNDEQGGMSLARALQAIEKAQQANLWFCGPAQLGDVLEKSWRDLHLPASAFHREFFAMR